MSKHSDKALTTLAAMNTQPADWKRADIRWVEEERMVMGDVTCPTCFGARHVFFDDAKKVVPPPQTKDFPPTESWHKDYDYYAWEKANREYREKAQKQSPHAWSAGNCPTCKCTNTRARMYGNCTGKVPGLVKRRMLVGYPVWPAGTKFDSRFNGGCSCGLCNKTVLKSGLVPCVGTGVIDGVTHGMWVGDTCARKFLPGTHFYPKPETELETMYETEEVPLPWSA